jgi:hypothetical protein
MKYLLLTLFLSGCITNNYYPEGKKKKKTVQAANEETQRQVNQTWGTTTLIPISVRRLPYED